MDNEIERFVSFIAPYAAGFNAVLVLILKAAKEFLPSEHDFHTRARKVREDLIEKSATSLESVLNAIHPRTDNNIDLIAAFTRTTYKCAHRYRRSFVVERRSSLYRTFFYILVLSIILFIASLLAPSAKFLIGIVALLIAAAQVITLIVLRRSADELATLESENED